MNKNCVYNTAPPVTYPGHILLCASYNRRILYKCEIQVFILLFLFISLERKNRQSSKCFYNHFEVKKEWELDRDKKRKKAATTE